MNSSNRIKYFAYGSNMNRARMVERGAHFFSVKPMTLRGYTLKFNKVSYRNSSVGFANIVPDKNGLVEGILYDIDVDGLYRLDKFEGYPMEYDRVMLEVKVSGKIEFVKTYMAPPEKTKDNTLPTREYLGHLLAAKEYLSEQYYILLQNQGTFD